MSWILIVVVVLAIAAIILFRKLSQKSANVSVDYLYQKAGALFSPAERSFYGALNTVAGKNVKIFGKVRVADVVVPKKGLPHNKWQKAFNKISGKHFDFLLCSNDDLSVICAIELNDKSHQSQKRQERDEFLNEVCNTAGVPFIQVHAKASYVVDEVKQILAPHLNIAELKSQKKTNAPQESVTIKKVCPMCSSPMVMRVAKKGSNAGKQFWACSTYPKCKHIEAIKA